MQPTTQQEFTMFINLILAVCVPFCPDRKLGPVYHQIGGRFGSIVFFQVKCTHYILEDDRHPEVVIIASLQRALLQTSMSNFERVFPVFAKYFPEESSHGHTSQMCPRQG